MKPKTIIPYFGGKSYHINWLKMHFPVGPTHFIDAMCGSAVVALNVSYPFVTINDLNHDVVNFFRILRSRYDEFKLHIRHTPYSREEFELAADRTGDPLEDARRFYIRALQGYGGNTSQNTHKGWTSNTAPHIVDNYFKSLTWKNRLVFLDEIVDKLRGFQIENLQVIDLLPKYDYPQNFIYLDPPYVRKTRNDNKRYKHEMTDQDHIDLFEKANALKCKAAISGYECPLYEEMYTAGGWMKHIGAGNRMTTGKRLVRETLWTNYHPNITLSLFN